MRSALTLLVITLLVQSPAAAQSWEASALLGLTPSAPIDQQANELDDLDIRGSFTWGIQGARFFTPSWAAEVLWTQQSTALELGTADAKADLFTMKVRQLDGNIVYQLGSADSRWRPFIFGGMGATFFTADTVESDTKLSLYGPGTDSGTFDFFTDAINGEEGVSREDYEASEDDNQLVTGVSGDAGGFGYFGFSYYEGAADKLNLVGVDSGDGNCVKPSVETIQNASYEPLSRPLFMYPKAEAMGRPEVKAFMEFVVAQAPAIAEAAKMVPLTDAQTQTAKDELGKAESGT